MLPLQSIKSRLGPMSFYRLALAIALPVMLQQFIMSMVSLVDSFMVAGLGDVSMAAVNVTNHLNFVFFVIVNTFCQAGGIYIAQFNGANDREGMRNAYSFKILFAFGIALLYFLICRTFPFRLVGLLTTNNAAQGEIAFIGSGYLKLVSWTFFPDGGINVRRDQLPGDSKAENPAYYFGNRDGYKHGRKLDIDLRQPRRAAS